MWNESEYKRAKEVCERQIKNGSKSPADYMQEYKQMIEIENYEAAKAITEVLEPLHYFTADTHHHIPSLKYSSKNNKIITKSTL